MTRIHGRSRLARLVPPALLLGGVAALSGCANPQADQALYAQTAFVGMPRQTLLSCAGVPDRQKAVDNVEYYTYSSQRITSTGVPGSRVGFGYGPWHRGWYGAGWGWPEETQVESRDCKANFTLKDGVVTKLVYGGASPHDRLGQCYQIVENCLALIPLQSSQRQGQ